MVSLCLLPCVLSANSAPTDINASNLTIAENSVIGTIIGEFNATDPDGDEISFHITSPFVDPSTIDGLSAWFDSSDLRTITPMAGSNQVLRWRNRVDSAVKMLSPSNKPTTGSSVNGFNVINFDFNASGYDRMFAYKDDGSAWSAVVQMAEYQVPTKMLHCSFYSKQDYITEMVCLSV